MIRPAAVPASALLLVAAQLAVTTCGGSGPTSAPATPAASVRAPAGDTLVCEGKGPDTIIQDFTVRWCPVAEAVRYDIEGLVVAARDTGGTPACRYRFETERRIPVLASVAAPVTEYALALPSAPAGETWFVKEFRLQVRAIDASGREAKLLGGAGLSDNFCP